MHLARIGLAFAALLAVTPLHAQNAATDLRQEAGCGPSKAEFNVKVDKKNHATAHPLPGKAIIYVFSQYITNAGYNTIGHVTTRIGMDGNWIGASHESSYLFFTADPGVHHLCSDVQSIFAPKNLDAATDLNAQAGKTYYYKVVIREVRPDPVHMFITPVGNNAEGLLLISNSALSTSQLKK